MNRSATAVRMATKPMPTNMTTMAMMRPALVSGDTSP
jgi:hypothetical protein